MKEYVKELNIIDFLGIIVPGALLVLLITGDKTDLLLWDDYFGSDATVWIKGTFLLIAGYLSGMLLHEIGDCLEKGAWCFHILDPKAYAANAVGTQKIEDAMVNANLLDKERLTQSFTYVIHPVIKGILAVFATALLLFLSTVGFCFAMESACNMVNKSLNPAIDAKIYFVIYSLLAVGIIVLLVLVCLLWSKYAHESKDQRRAKAALKRIQRVKDSRKIDCDSFINTCTLIIDILSACESNSFSSPEDYNIKREYIFELLQKQICYGVEPSKDWVRLYKIALRFIKPLNTSSGIVKRPKSKVQWRTIHNICVCNPSIQTYITTHGVHGKQSMFDSFRHVMRNLIICIAIVNAYSIWYPVEIYQDIARHFISRSNTPQDFLLLSICFTLTVLVMFIRYNHFAFLRYKYEFEHFIEISQASTVSSAACEQNSKNDPQR